MAQIDRRIQRTQKLLGDALVELILEKGYDQVTIKDITERADVAYITFFRRYDSKEKLLLHHIGETIEELSNMVDHTAVTDPLAHGRIEGREIFRNVQVNHQLYRALLTSPSGHLVVKKIRDRIAKNILCYPIFKETEESPIPFEVVTHHIASSLIALIEWWLEHDMNYSIERMGEMYAQLIIVPTWQYFLQEDSPIAI